jgi:predicted SAM-dependent methyltransferase
LELLDEGSLASLPAGSFPVITMWHVLEHVHDLEGRIREIENLLMPGGKLIVAVPNHLSHDARYYGKYWAAYDVPRHLYHFDPNSMRNLFSRHGFQMDRIIPMRWDAFYVSMLSERYKKGRANFLEAIFRGFVSNLRAKSGEYSSQIYILSKKPL